MWTEVWLVSCSLPGFQSSATMFTPIEPQPLRQHYSCIRCYLQQYLKEYRTPPSTRDACKSLKKRWSRGPRPYRFPTPPPLDLLKMDILKWSTPIWRESLSPPRLWKVDTQDFAWESCVDFVIDTTTRRGHARALYSRFGKGRVYVRNHDLPQKFTESSPIWTTFLYPRMTPPIALLLSYIWSHKQTRLVDRIEVDCTSSN